MPDVGLDGNGSGGGRHGQVRGTVDELYGTVTADRQLLSEWTYFAGGAVNELTRGAVEHLQE